MTPVRFLVSLAILFVVIVCIFPSTTEQAQILDEELRQYFSISRSHIAFHISLCLITTRIWNCTINRE